MSQRIVTFCYPAVNALQNLSPTLHGMKTKISLTLMCALSMAVPTIAADTKLKHRLAGELQLQVEQEIFVNSQEEAIAGRSFTMSYDVGDVDDAGNYPLTLTSVRGTYTAHGMAQRLSATHLTGSTFSLVPDTNSYRAEGAGGSIDLGPVTDGGFDPAAALAGFLPGTPDEPVTVGMSWMTERKLVSLIGWSWAGADIVYQNEVVDVSDADGGAVVRVETKGRATIHAAEGHNGFVGEGQLDRTINWSFDAASGKVLSFTLEQQANGTNQLPQGQIPVRQRTVVELVGS